MATDAPAPAAFLSKFADNERVHESFYRPEGVDSKVKIKLYYTFELAESFAILRYLLESKEFSDRGMEVTQFIVTQVENHYAAWAYRKSYFLKLADPQTVRPEIDFTTHLILQEPKGFQTWDHLRFCYDRLGQLAYPYFVDFLSQIYDHDAKNYHAWTFRVWATGRFGFHQDEWGLMSELLKRDVTNNSIWSYRIFLAANIQAPPQGEKEFVTGLINGGQLSNESAWFYFDSLYENEGVYSPEQASFLESLVAGGKANRFVYKSLIFNELRRPRDERNKDKLGKWVSQLTDQHDVNRKRFWQGFAKSFIG